MFVDLDSPESDLDRAPDVCIVGAGAAGIAIAAELIGTGVRTLLLEAGDLTASRSLEARPVRSAPSLSLEQSRARRFGGSTTLWAGQALPLDPIDLESRPWVPGSGWPISWMSLQSHYRRAERLLGVADDSSYDSATWPGGPRPQIIDRINLEFRYSQFTLAPDLGRRFRPALESARNVQVGLNANVRELVLSHDRSRVERARVSDSSRNQVEVVAKRFVLAGGGIENPRLLLASSPGGIGNEQDLVGRFFQEHAHLRLPFTPMHRRELQRRFHTRRAGGRRAFPKLVLTADAQERYQVLNIGADLCYSNPGIDPLAGPRSVVAGLRGAAPRADLARGVARTARNPGRLAGAAYRHFVLGHKPSEGIGTPGFCLQCETLPRRESRVRLSDLPNADGVREAEVDWRLGAEELETFKTFAVLLADDLLASGTGELDRSSMPETLEALEAVVDPGYHHIGTTRMGHDPRSGVVDPDCTVHGVPNLHIAGSSVFPTGGFSNPTLTLLALALRLADRLREPA